MSERLLAQDMSVPAEQPALESLRDNYLSKTGDASLLYSGVQYIRNGQKTDGFPFFESDQPLPGSISIAGLTHPGLKIQYDLTGDQLIISNLAATGLFVVQPELVDSFQIDGHDFISIRGGQKGSVMRPGYYEVVRASALTLYIRREKQLQTRAGYDLSAYLSYDRIFIVRDGVVHPVVNRSDLLALFGEKKDAVKKFLRSENLNYKKQPADAVINLFRHYEGLGQ